MNEVDKQVAENVKQAKELVSRLDQNMKLVDVLELLVDAFEKSGLQPPSEYAALAEPMYEVADSYTGSAKRITRLAEKLASWREP